MPTDPAVSIIIPAYNSAPFLAETLGSAFAQTYQDFEIIVVNDGSTDNTDEVLAEFLDRIIYIKQPNRGVMAARNAGLKAARGRYIALLDSDDLLMPRFLEALVGLLEADPGLSVAYPNARYFGWPKHDGKLHQDVFPVSEPVTFDRVLKRECYIFGLLVFRRKVIDEIGGYDESLEGQGAEDFELWLRMLRHGHRFKFTREVLARYRWRQDSLSNTSVKILRCVISVYEKLLGNELTDDQRQWIEARMPEWRAQLSYSWFKDALAKRNYAEAITHLADARKFYRQPKLALLEIGMKAAPQLVYRLASQPPTADHQPPKLKILHVIDSLGIGGMERVVIDVANGLDPARFEQVVCCISRRGEAADQLRDEVRCVDLGKGEKADRLMPLKLARIIRRERPDIVHSQSWSGVDTALAKIFAPKFKLVQSEHGRNYSDLRRQSFMRRMARRGVYHLADSVFAISDEVRQFYCKQTGFSVERMQVIPNGIDVRRIDEADAGGIREELGIAPDDFVFGTVARLDLTKDTMTLARAFAAIALPRRNPKFKLLIVGDGEQRNRLEEFVAMLNLNRVVIFTGLRRDVPRLLRAMDVFVMSSVSEGLPLTVLEAMAARLPIVATNVGALPDLVEESQTGFLVPIRHAVAMSDKLEKFIANPQLAKTFGQEARRKVEREFTLERMLRNYAELYENL